MKKREVLLKNKLFQLVHQQRDHKTWYEIQLYATWYEIPKNIEEEISEYFGKTTTKYSNSWRIWNREEAHRQFTFVTLRWL